MNICILDGYTLNPGDLSWEGIKALGNCDIHDRTKPEEIAERAANAEIILTNSDQHTGLQHYVSCSNGFRPPA